MSHLRRAVDGADWVRGPPDAPVTLLEYGDFQCPSCGRAFWQLKELDARAGYLIRFAFRHFPLSQLHPHAMLAAEAAEAAGAQGRFWEMHDRLFAEQHHLGRADLLTHAAALGLDVRRFARDLDEHRHLPKVRREFSEGARSGVTKVPALFMNGARWHGEATADALLAGIQGSVGPVVDLLTGLPFPWA